MGQVIREQHLLDRIADLERRLRILESTARVGLSEVQIASLTNLTTVSATGGYGNPDSGPAGPTVTVNIGSSLSALVITTISATLSSDSSDLPILFSSFDVEDEDSNQTLAAQLGTRMYIANLELSTAFAGRAARAQLIRNTNSYLPGNPQVVFPKPGRYTFTMRYFRSSPIGATSVLLEDRDLVVIPL